ncbi:MAG: DegT/DnrJ/EryC1/StrS family aminotransferase [Magnetococcales bacterium]|nr:DegT/DnrJ/EryC1/StrS family aminotransferase [Magnetococcales bacterium]
MNVPFFDASALDLAIWDEVQEEIRDVVAGGQFVLGEAVGRFERRFADFCGAAHGVAVNSGTDALILALKALGIGPGDEVITVPNSFIATVSCIALIGARPVLVDVGEDDNLDPALLAAALTPRTRAILPVHLTGNPARMDEILAFAHRHALPVVEDAAQAIGSRWAGRQVGTWGAMGCFSLHPYKVLGGWGDGGMVVTEDAALADRLRGLRNHGISGGGIPFFGFNSRLDTLQAVVLKRKLDRMEELIRRRRAMADAYRQGLSGVVGFPRVHPQAEPVWQNFVVRCPRRDDLMAYLKERGIETRIHYPTPVPLQPVGAAWGWREGDFPVTERLRDEILSLPFHPGLSDEALGLVCQAVRGFYDGVPRKESLSGLRGSRNMFPPEVPAHS